MGGVHSLGSHLLEKWASSDPNRIGKAAAGYHIVLVFEGRDIRFLHSSLCRHVYKKYRNASM